MTEHANLWVVIAALGMGSFGLRFLFTGVLSSWIMPGWVLRHLRYTAVAILPGLVAPMVLWPDATGGAVDPARLTAGIVTFAIAMMFRKLLVAIIGGAATLYVLLYLLA